MINRTTSNNNAYGIALVAVLLGFAALAMANQWKEMASWLLFVGILVVFMWSWKN